MRRAAEGRTTVPVDFHCLYSVADLYRAGTEPWCSALVRQAGHSGYGRSLDQYQTYEQFDAAVKEQIKYITKWTAVATVISQRVHRDLAPKPLMSIMYEGCMEKGKDVSSGGAMYNFGPGVVWSGLATYADAMAAIKKLVFDDKKYTLKQLNEALKADFEGYDQIKADCLAAPKYGNDDDYADLIAADLIDFTEDGASESTRRCTPVLSHGTLSISNNTPFGQLTGASAGGRKAWTPLSDGISPTQGADFKGPTAIIKSVVKAGQRQHEHRYGTQLQDHGRPAGYAGRRRRASSPCCVQHVHVRKRRNAVQLSWTTKR